MPQPPATLHQSSLSPGFPETPDPTKMQQQLMHQFHSCIASQLFPHGHQFITAIMSEELVLMWTILQPTLDMPWQHMYAWNGQLDGIDKSNFQSTYWQLSKFFKGASIAKALWNSSNDDWPFPKLQFVNLPHIVQSSQAILIHPPLTNLLDEKINLILMCYH